MEMLWLLLFALVIDWFLGDPNWLWSRLPHPVVLFGKTVGLLDKNFNRSSDSSASQYKKGALSISFLVIAAILIGWGISSLLRVLGSAGWLIELAIVTILLAQKSLLDHVHAVGEGLEQEGLSGGRKAVSMIVGRDPEQLDQAGVSRAAIESLAENFSDGVVAPAFWYAVFGLPGIFAYKMINTADSMIAYRNEKYLWFGRVAAKMDDLANWVPARLSGFLIVLGASISGGAISLRNAAFVMMRDNGLHRSPNAGWPEAAMAGACDISLGGPREYADETVAQSFINANGKKELDHRDIKKALLYFRNACLVLRLFVGVSAFVF